jgi:hypothetical protein
MMKELELPNADANDCYMVLRERPNHERYVIKLI